MQKENEEEVGMVLIIMVQVEDERIEDDLVALVDHVVVLLLKVVIPVVMVLLNPVDLHVVPIVRTVVADLEVEVFLLHKVIVRIVIVPEVTADLYLGVQVEVLIVLVEVNVRGREVGVEVVARVTTLVPMEAVHRIVNVAKLNLQPHHHQSQKIQMMALKPKIAEQSLCPNLS